MRGSNDVKNLQSKGLWKSLQPSAFARRGKVSKDPRPDSLLG